MKISFNWLKQYIETDLDAEQAARILTDIGLEVEALEKTESIRGGLAGVGRRPRTYMREASRCR